jgi:hypothetical protein
MEMAVVEEQLVKYLSEAHAMEKILEQEEAAAELVAGTFDRSLEMPMGETPRSPVPSLTPLGKLLGAEPWRSRTSRTPGLQGQAGR